MFWDDKGLGGTPGRELLPTPFRINRAEVPVRAWWVKDVEDGGVAEKKLGELVLPLVFGKKIRKPVLKEI